MEIELVRAFILINLVAKFERNRFINSEVIARTLKSLQNKQNFDVKGHNSESYTRKVAEIELIQGFIVIFTVVLLAATITPFRGFPFITV